MFIKLIEGAQDSKGNEVASPEYSNFTLGNLYMAQPAPSGSGFRVYDDNGDICWVGTSNFRIVS